MPACHTFKKKARRRPIKVGMPRKNSSNERRFATDADYRARRIYVLRAFEKQDLDVYRFFPVQRWCRAEFREYYPRTDTVKLYYEIDGKEEICTFENFMHPLATRMYMRDEVEAATLLMSLQAGC